MPHKNMAGGVASSLASADDVDMDGAKLFGLAWMVALLPPAIASQCSAYADVRIRIIGEDKVNKARPDSSSTTLQPSTLQRAAALGMHALGLHALDVHALDVHALGMHVWNAHVVVIAQAPMFDHTLLVHCLHQHSRQQRLQ